MDLRPDVLLLSRGLGRGHATRDIEIARELNALEPHLRIAYASYAEGLGVLRDAGVDAADLDLPPTGYDHLRIPRIGRLLMDARPSLVVADEELYALPLCATLGIPVILVTNWIVGADRESRAGFLQNADRVIMADYEDSFVIPQWLNAPVCFVGPICRRVAIDAGERLRVRSAAGVRPGDKLVTVTVSGLRLCNAAFFRCCATALAALSPRIHAIIETGALHSMYDFLRHELSANVRFVERIDGVLERYAASDLVLTRGGHTTLWELAAAGVPAVCVPYLPDEDPLHHVYATNMERRGTLEIVWEHDLTPGFLQQYLDCLLCDDARLQAMRNSCRGVFVDGAGRAAAGLISEHLRSAAVRA